MHSIAHKVALVTGAAKRIGAEIAQRLHGEGFNLVIHYQHSIDDAKKLVNTLNAIRTNSAIALAANLNNLDEVKRLCESATSHWQQLDVLVNNASTFYSTPLENASENDWDDLININLKAPFFLAKYTADALRKSRGSIINIADIYAARPLIEHSIYSIAKAGNVMLTKTLAQELAPLVRVNGIAPGAILWPEQENKLSADDKDSILQKIPLHKKGSEDDIATALIFLVTQAPYMTGQILTIDGGRSINI